MELEHEKCLEIIFHSNAKVELILMGSGGIQVETFNL